ncbi:hypothetical protein CAOG_00242 [Capsaspora owczarzaki ATCC 30864]|uniref:Protein kish n=1 Tax=Capsaspora owczarzaki (strain ATCC 30864) TaxID=595528 RepID=A0A0D2WGQ9_CAPO3|nr:hypothetical protein CAOG_00242 [Capsaspora owczarzaki ATCC 30864]KJE88615.1 hypothetical protein CAOG_000242 [Capsaspora owczarzaki ATCC 30864]|eukprot:XP_004365113.1 hypothetical protein CAOG_00242 [Capsaspora owczarzaki ATCC 30864]
MVTLNAPKRSSSCAGDYLTTCQSAIFNFQSLLLVVLLVICTCTYIHDFAPALLDRHKTGQHALANG